MENNETFGFKNLTENECTMQEAKQKIPRILRGNQNVVMKERCKLSDWINVSTLYIHEKYEKCKDKLDLSTIPIKRLNLDFLKKNSHSLGVKDLYLPTDMQSRKAKANSVFIL